MALAIFDLDNTLLAGDSDHRWGEFLCEAGLVDPADYRQSNDAFYAQYEAGSLDMVAYLSFVLAPLAGMPVSEVRLLQDRFLRECVEPMLLNKAFDLIDQHRVAGDTLLLMTATHSVVADPVANRLGFEHWLCSGVEIVDGVYTGKTAGSPCFKEGKVAHLEDWRLSRTDPPALQDCWFYSDSHNDLPLLSAVGHPVAVNPDATLLQTAIALDWTVISLRED